MRTATALDRASKRYGATTAVDGVTPEVPRGPTVALLGPDGAGRTSTVAWSEAPDGQPTAPAGGAAGAVGSDASVS